jgi:hypothetical protein
MDAQLKDQPVIDKSQVILDVVVVFYSYSIVVAIDAHNCC